MSDEELINELLEERRLLEAENANLKSELKTARAVTEQKRAEFLTEIAELKQRIDELERRAPDVRNSPIGDSGDCDEVCTVCGRAIDGEKPHAASDCYEAAMCDQGAAASYLEDELESITSERDDLRQRVRAETIALCQRALRRMASEFTISPSTDPGNEVLHDAADNLPAAVEALAKEPEGG